MIILLLLKMRYRPVCSQTTGFSGVLKPLQGLLDGKLVISIVAGAEIATLSALLGNDRIVRVMPNTPHWYRLVHMVYLPMQKLVMMTVSWRVRFWLLPA